MPIGGLLVRACQLQHSRLAAIGTADLEADRQALAGKAARDRYRGDYPTR